MIEVAIDRMWSSSFMMRRVVKPCETSRLIASCRGGSLPVIISSGTLPAVSSIMWPPFDENVRQSFPTATTSSYLVSA